MKHIAACLILLTSTSAFADDTPRGNVFGADLSHYDLAVTVAAFETACMPFVLHTTEMTRADDIAHNAKLFKSRGFEFISRETVAQKFIIEPARTEWKPKAQAINNKLTGQWNVFDGTSMRLITYVESTGEISSQDAYIPPVYKTMKTEVETYALDADDRLTATINWNYPSQNHPGKSCEIRLENASVSVSNFIANVIEKDEDWRVNDNSWSQCVLQGKDEFLFTAARTDTALTLSMTRNDFFETKVCK